VSSVRTQALLWYGQRVSGMVLALCVVVHLGVVIYAVRGGLTAAEILGRTRGSWAVAAFYGVFVVACAIHAPIGVASLVAEIPGTRAAKRLPIAPALAFLILAMGMRAVYAVVAP
jgi:fumarate reductase subunit C